MTGSRSFGVVFGVFVAFLLGPAGGKAAVAGESWCLPPEVPYKVRAAFLEACKATACGFKLLGVDVSPDKVRLAVEGPAGFRLTAVGVRPAPGTSGALALEDVVDRDGSQVDEPDVPVLWQAMVARLGPGLWVRCGDAPQAEGVGDGTQQRPGTAIISLAWAQLALAMSLVLLFTAFMAALWRMCAEVMAAARLTPKALAARLAAVAVGAAAALLWVWHPCPLAAQDTLRDLLIGRGFLESGGFNGAGAQTSWMGIRQSGFWPLLVSLVQAGGGGVKACCIFSLVFSVISSVLVWITVKWVLIGCSKQAAAFERSGSEDRWAPARDLAPNLATAAYVLSLCLHAEMWNIVWNPTLLPPLTVLFTSVLVLALRLRTFGWYMALALTLSLLVQAHPVSAVHCVTLPLALLLRVPVPKEWRRSLLTLAAFAVAFTVPFLLFSFGAIRESCERFGETLPQGPTSDGFRMSAWWLFSVCGLFLSLWTFRPRRSHEYRFLQIMAAPPLLLLAALLLGKADALDARYVMPLAMPGIVLLGPGLQALWRAPRGRRVSVLAVVAFWAAVPALVLLLVARDGEYRSTYKYTFCEAEAVADRLCADGICGLRDVPGHLRASSIGNLLVGMRSSLGFGGGAPSVGLPAYELFWAERQPFDGAEPVARRAGRTLWFSRLAAPALVWDKVEIAAPLVEAGKDTRSDLHLRTTEDARQGFPSFAAVPDHPFPGCVRITVPLNATADGCVQLEALDDDPQRGWRAAIVSVSGVSATLDGPRATLAELKKGDTGAVTAEFCRDNWTPSVEGIPMVMESPCVSRQ